MLLRSATELILARCAEGGRFPVRYTRQVCSRQRAHGVLDDDGCRHMQAGCQQLKTTRVDGQLSEDGRWYCMSKTMSSDAGMLSLQAGRPPRGSRSQKSTVELHKDGNGRITWPSVRHGGHVGTLAPHRKAAPVVQRSGTASPTGRLQRPADVGTAPQPAFRACSPACVDSRR